LRRFARGHRFEPVARLRLTILTILAVNSTAALAQRDTMVVAGPRYARGPLYRMLFGAEYRQLWTTPVRAPVLDLGTFAGGLTPLSAGGGFQTLSLWFRGADGFQYGFRSVDKRLAVPEEIDSTFIAELARDQTSSQHPGAPPVAARLMEAAGILHTGQMLVVLPDDPRLGEHRERFAHALGYLERRAIVEPGRPGFAGALEIVSWRRLIPRLFDSPAHRVHARDFLTARLVDLFLGDWDRHRGQWTWARFTDSTAAAPTHWRPIPEDRDHAFVRFDGLMLSLARATVAPQLIEFGGDYASVEGQTWNGRDIDRWFLGGLEREAWDSTARWLQSRLTDAVIDTAVAALPEAWRELDGARLAHTLKLRRDALPAAAMPFYHLLARDAEIHATRAAENVLLVRLFDGRLRVCLFARGDTLAYLVRTLDPRETRELRLYLYGGGDSIVIRGMRDDPRSGVAPAVRYGSPIPVRIVSGAATVIDSSGAAEVRLYSDSGVVNVAGRVAVDRRPWNPPLRRPDAPPPRDWGARRQPVLWLGFGPDVGVFGGAGVVRTAFGFRTLPYASQWRVRAGWASEAGTGRVAIDGALHRENSAVRAELHALASGIEVLRWHGRGNSTTASGPSAYYRVTQHRYAVHGSLVVPAAGGHLAVGPALVFNDTRLQAGRIIADSLPYGANDFGQAGLRASWQLDTRDVATAPRRGVTVALGGAVYPAVWDVTRTFAEAHAQATTYVSARTAPLAPVLALRAGYKRVFGRYPFHEAAFIGDAATVRLGRQNRYGGDAAAWGSAELRLKLLRARILVPGEIGLTGLADIGRVWLRGETSDTWHSALGGGLWWSFIRPSNVLSLTVAAGRERTALYLGAGFAY
jgi:hypothetical protein